MKYILILLLFPMLSAADTVTKINCDYLFMATPLSSSELNLNSDGTPDSSVIVTMPGQSNKYTATPDVLEDGEIVHIWVSKEQPDSHIEMITYKDPKADGVQSKMINHDVPMGQEMAGPCKFTSIDKTP